MDEAPAVEVHIVKSLEPPGGMGEAGTSGHRSRRDQRGLCGHRQALATVAGRHRRAEAARIERAAVTQTHQHGIIEEYISAEQKAAIVTGASQGVGAGRVRGALSRE